MTAADGTVTNMGSLLDPDVTRALRSWGAVRRPLFSPAYDQRLSGAAELLVNGQTQRLRQSLAATGFSTAVQSGVLGALASHQNFTLFREPLVPRRSVLFDVAKSVERTMWLIDPGRQLRSTLAAALAPLERYRKNFDALTGQIAAFAARQAEVDENVVRFVLKHGWPIPLYLPMRAYEHIASLAGRPKLEVRRSMMRWFAPETRAFRDCAAILLETNTLSTRRPLIEQVLRAHRNGQYYLVINGLLPLVEGVLVDHVFANQPVPARRRVHTALAELRDVHDDEGGYGAALKAVENLIIAGAGGCIALFTPTDPVIYASREPRALNRHAILHGYARRYGSHANALKLMLLITVMAEVVELDA